MKTRDAIRFSIVFGGFALCAVALGQGIELIGDPEKSKTMAEQWLSFLAPIATFVGAVRVFAKPISTVIAGGVQRVVTKAEETESADDDKMVDAILSSNGYFWLAWVIDYLLSIKLPAKKPSSPSKP